MQGMAGELKSQILKNFDEVNVIIGKYAGLEENKKKEAIVTFSIYPIVAALCLFHLWKDKISFIGEENVKMINKFKMFIIIGLLILKQVIMRKAGISEEGAFEITYNGTVVFSGLKENRIPNNEEIIKRIKEIREKNQ